MPAKSAGLQWVQQRNARRVTPQEIARSAGLPERTPLVDRTVEQGYVYQSAVFQVPAGTSLERVRLVEDKYQRKFGNALEQQGFQVLAMSAAFTDDRPGCPPDRIRYRMIARCRRRPVRHVIDVPDSLVPELLTKGYQLT